MTGGQVPLLVLEVGPAPMPDFVSTAHLYAALCWPPSVELAAYRLGARAIGSGTLFSTLHDEPGRRQEFIDAFPEMMVVTAAQRRAVWKAMKIRLRHRMAASRMALGFLEERFTGRPAKLPRR